MAYGHHCCKILKDDNKILKDDNKILKDDNKILKDDETVLPVPPRDVLGCGAPTPRPRGDLFMAFATRSPRPHSGQWRPSASFGYINMQP